MKHTFKERLDEYYYELANIFRLLKFHYEKMFKGSHSFLKNNVNLKGKLANTRCFVLGNSPSLNTQDLTQLKGEIVFMVNRGFLNKNYREIRPQFHVIVDPKLASGEWPITFLDEIHELNPHVTFLLNAAWYDLEKFQPYKEKYEIYWIDQSLEFTSFTIGKKLDLTKRSYSKYVVEQAITSAIYMGAREIYVSGVEGNGIAYTLLNKDSHSYGSNQEDLHVGWLDISRSYYSGSYWLKVWHYIEQFCRKNGILLVNLTEGGIMDMMERKDFESIVKR